MAGSPPAGSGWLIIYSQSHTRTYKNRHTKFTKISALGSLKSISWFHVLSVLTCYVTLHVRLRASCNASSVEDFGSMGAARLEVRAVFASAAVAAVAGVFVVKGAAESALFYGGEVERVNT